MENASDALLMAGQVLVFIIALTICISSFTNLRAEVNQLIGQEETIEMVKGTNGYINYMDSKDANATRRVSAETLISSMYRATKENYIIYIVAEDCEAIRGGTGDSAVDLTEAEFSLTIAGKPVITVGQKMIKITIGSNTNQDINTKLKNGFYEDIKDLSFYEYLGEYQNNSEVTSENKQTYRVITYIEKNYFESLA